MFSKCYGWVLTITLAVIVFLPIKGNALEDCPYKMFISHTDPGNTIPRDVCGPVINPPWVEWDPMEPVFFPAGNTIWIAKENYHDPAGILDRWFWYTAFDFGGFEDFVLGGYIYAYYYDGPDLKIGDSWALRAEWFPDVGDQWHIYYESTPLPDWVTVQWTRNAKASQQDSVLIEMDGIRSRFWASPGPDVYIDSLRYGGPSDTVQLTEIWIFNDSIPLNANALPIITAPLQSGPWSYELVYADPYGNPCPQGGWRCYTTGPGIGSWEPFSLEFYLAGTTQYSYSLHLYDAFRGDYVLFVIPVTAQAIPTLTEWGLIIFSIVLFGWMAFVIIKRRRRSQEMAI